MMSRLTESSTEKTMPAIAAARGVLAAWRASGSTVLTVSPCRGRRSGRHSALLTQQGMLAIWRMRRSQDVTARPVFCLSPG